MTNHPENQTPLSIAALLESILFVAPEPVPVLTIATVLEISAKQVEAAAQELSGYYQDRGLQVQRIGDRLHLTTSARSAQVIERFLGVDHTTGLSRAALETLAIISYRQPLTRPQVDAIRGVNSDSVIDSLIAKELVEEIGRAEGPGRPILYGTTPAFLQHFGLRSIGDLPPLQGEEPGKESQVEATVHVSEEVLKG
jgi:segregation and condensation protein B